VPSTTIADSKIEIYGKILKIKKGKKVTVTFHAKASESPVKKKSDTENI